MQLSDPRLRTQPTMYFGPGTALARVLSRPQPQTRRIGVLGLGVGTIAAYGRTGDTLRFYELDRNVLELAQRDFSFLRESPAQVSVHIGDGRVLLSREPPQRFDVLVLDAFSSDSVPVHLLTREAFAVYLRHLAPHGLLLANVSNRHLAVERVARASAAANGLACGVLQTYADAEHFVSRVRWAVMARTPAELAAVLPDETKLMAAGPDVLWTDERASLWRILR
jgi:spermidine synthase